MSLYKAIPFAVYLSLLGLFMQHFLGFWNCDQLGEFPQLVNIFSKLKRWFLFLPMPTIMQLGHKHSDPIQNKFHKIHFTVNMFKLGALLGLFLQLKLWGFQNTSTKCFTHICGKHSQRFWEHKEYIQTIPLNQEKAWHMLEISWLLACAFIQLRTSWCILCTQIRTRWE